MDLVVFKSPVYSFLYGILDFIYLLFIIIICLDPCTIEVFIVVFYNEHLYRLNLLSSEPVRLQWTHQWTMHYVSDRHL